MPKKEPTLIKMTRPSVLSMFSYVLARAIMDEQRSFRLDDLLVAVALASDTITQVVGDIVIDTEVREIVQRLCSDGLIEFVEPDVYRVVRINKASGETKA